MKQKIRKHMINTFIKTQEKASSIVQKGEAVIKNKDGLSHTMEVLLWSLGAAAIVALIVGLAFLLIKSEIFPDFSAKMKEILNMK